MATSIAYAAGAKLASPDSDTLAIIGEGGLEMHVSELWLLKRYGLDVPVVVMNNGVYGQVNEWLDKYHDGRTEHASTTALVDGPDGLKVVPDIQHFASAYNIPFCRTDRREDLAGLLKIFRETKGARMFEGNVYQMGAYPMIPNLGTSANSIRPDKL